MVWEEQLAILATPFYKIEKGSLPMFHQDKFCLTIFHSDRLLEFPDNQEKNWDNTHCPL
ncbi:MAG: hypothetical protein IJA10_09465 [Lachnospiraceae bacterium]|nr:hypothetical protein [Lachnospiraceae bacterium]